MIQIVEYICGLKTLLVLVGITVE